MTFYVLGTIQAQKACLAKLFTKHLVKSTCIAKNTSPLYLNVMWFWQRFLPINIHFMFGYEAEDNAFCKSSFAVYIFSKSVYQTMILVIPTLTWEKSSRSNSIQVQELIQDFQCNKTMAHVIMKWETFEWSMIWSTIRQNLSLFVSHMYRPQCTQPGLWTVSYTACHFSTCGPSLWFMYPINSTSLSLISFLS